jgi:glycosyltransferase involved in cell wall biosynthesis
MRRFGSISPFVEQGQGERRIGRLVANHDFIKALVRFGAFDELVLANPSVSNLRDFERVVESWDLGDVGRRVRAVPLVDLPAVMARDDFHVFHVGGWGAFMPGLHHMRARHARNAWPITGMIFSIHGRDVIDYAVRMCRAALCPYDAVFCLSQDGRQAFARLLEGAATIAGQRFRGRLEALPLGIDDDLVDVRGDRAAARRRLQIPEDAVVLLVLGRITPSQKMDLAPLLKTFAREILPRTERAVVLLIAGGASEGDVRLLNELVDAYGVRAQVRLHPNFLARVKPDLLAGADVLVAVTDNTQETFGLSVLEALGARLPVVASRFDGYKDLVIDGEDGFLVDTWWCEADPLAGVIDVMDPNVAQLVQAQSVAVDLDQLADRILTLVHDDGRRQRMGERGRQKVDAEYRFSAVIRRYEACWDALAGEAAAQGRPAQSANEYALGVTDIFSGYPTAMLGVADRVVAVPGSPIDARYVELGPLLDGAVLQAIVSRAHEPIVIEELLPCAATPTRGWFSVMWLLKYGCLRRMGE